MTITTTYQNLLLMNSISDDANGNPSNAKSGHENETAVETGRIQASSIKEFKSLVQKLSRPGSKLSKTELQQFEKLTEQFGGKLRYDLNPVKGKFLKPHVQVEGLGSKVGSRYIWLGE